MVEQLPSIDLDSVTDLAGIVDEVRRSGHPRVIRLHGEDAAMLVPLPRRGRKRTHARRSRRPTAAEVARSRAGIEAAAGAWGDIDAAELKRMLRRQRDIATRPDVSL